MNTTPPPARLIPFRFSVVQTYVLVFSDFEMRIIKRNPDTGERGYVIDPDIDDIAVIESPYAEADLPRLTYTQSADTMYLAHPNYPPTKLTRTDHHLWDFETVSFLTVILPPTGLAGEYIGALDIGTRDIKYAVASVDAKGRESMISPAVLVTVNSVWETGARVNLSWDIVPEAESYRIYKNSRGFYGLIGAVDKGAADILVVDTLSSSDHDNHPKDLAFDASTITFWRPDNTFGADPTVEWIGADLGAATEITSFRLMQSEQRASSCASSVTLDSSDNGTDWTEVETFAVSRHKKTMDERFLSVPVTARYFRLHPAAADDYVPSRSWEVASLTFRGTGAITGFTDDNINEDSGQGPINDFNPFPGAGDYPGAVGIFQQRLWWARTDNFPSTIWGSRSGQFESMAKATPLRNDDALEFTLDSTEVNEIRHIVPRDRLLIFTLGSEWVLSGSNGNEAITPYSASARLQGSRGCATPCPLVVGHMVLFVQRNAATIREMDYSLASDIFRAENVSVLSSHLFEKHAVTEWAYQQDPWSIVWAIRDDGVLLGFTYLKEQEIWAWHHHVTDGQFLSICSIDEGDGQDEVYFLIQRENEDGGFVSVEWLTHRLPDPPEA